ncbi:MAG: hypothetical protein SFV32_14220 [Opitutaceae bacterium]|nr:hypothetical protein [Opitutaceae bacterium]
MANTLDRDDTVCVQIAPIQAPESGDFAPKAKAEAHASAQERPKIRLINGDQLTTAMALIENTSLVVKQITELPPEPPAPGTLLNVKL